MKALYLETLIPEGCKLSKDTKSQELIKILKAGETATSTVTYELESSIKDENSENKNDSEYTIKNNTNNENVNTGRASTGEQKNRNKGINEISNTRRIAIVFWFRCE